MISKTDIKIQASIGKTVHRRVQRLLPAHRTDGPQQQTRQDHRVSAAAPGAAGGVHREDAGRGARPTRPRHLRAGGHQAGHGRGRRLPAQQGEEHSPGRAEGRLLRHGQQVQDLHPRGVLQLEQAVQSAQ